MSSELKADGEPMRLMLLGEKLVAFRDTDGRVGDIRSPLPASLRLAVSSAATSTTGIRCAYHGWKFDVTGNCLDQPNLEDKNKYPAGMPANRLQDRRAAAAWSSSTWASAQMPPPLPELEAIMPDQPDDRNIALTHRDCN